MKVSQEKDGNNAKAGAKVSILLKNPQTTRTSSTWPAPR